jgi:heptosyltransferase-1/heptosyltransferase-2
LSERNGALVASPERKRLPRGDRSERPRVLIARFSAIGDCVMAAYAATAIRLRFPNAHLVWAVEPRCSEVLDTDRLLDEIALFPRGEWKRQRSHPATWVDQMRRYLSLRRCRFDWALDLQGHSKTALCVRLCGAKRRLAVRPTDAFARLLNPVSTRSREPEHWVERHLALLGELGDFPIPERPLMPQLFDERGSVSARGSRPLATLSMASSSDAKRYPVEKWRLIARKLAQEGFEVVALGGPDDPALGLKGDTAQDLVGKTTLRQTMAAIQMSAVHVAADTGTGHIAAAYGVPVVSLFGPSNPDRFRPYTRDGLVLRNGTDPGAIDPEDVLQAVATLHGTATFSHR